MLSQVSGLLYKSTVCVAHLETWTPDSSKEAWLFFFLRENIFIRVMWHRVSMLERLEASGYH